MGTRDMETFEMVTSQSLDKHFVDMAAEISRNTNGSHRGVGASIVNSKNEVVSSGFNYVEGIDGDCGVGGCIRTEINAPSGTRYKECKTTHAEVNALRKAGKKAFGCSII